MFGQKYVLFALVIISLVVAIPGNAALPDMIPQESPLALSLNITKLLQIPAVKKLYDDAMQNVGQQDTMRDFITNTGIQIDRDVHNMLVFLAGADQTNAGQFQAGFLFDGSFSAAKIIELIQTNADLATSVQLENVHGFNGLINATNPNGTGVFLNENTVALGSMETLGHVAAVAHGKGKAWSAHPFLGPLMQKANALTVWAGIVVSPAWKTEAMKTPVTAPLADLKAVVVGFDLEKSFVFQFTGELEKKDLLPDFLAALNNYIDATKAWAQGTPEVLELLDLARVEGKGTTAQLSIVMSKQHFEKILTSLGERLSPSAAKQ